MPYDQGLGPYEGWLGHLHRATQDIVISQNHTKYLQEIVSLIGYTSDWIEYLSLG